MNVLGYFDLSKPATFSNPAPSRATPAEAETGQPSVSASQPMSIKWQMATYMILLSSILASRFLDLYRAGVASKFVVDWQYLLFLAIASLLAFPVVYDKARFNRDQPVLLQICLIFTAGMGWEKIVATAIGK